MRTLSASLLAEQRSSSTQPYVRVRLFDHDVGSVRLRWERWYSGTEAAGPCVAAVPDDGSLLRARIDAATGALSQQRVAAPTASSDFSSWTSLGTLAAGPRLGLSAAGTRALIASLRSDGVSVEVRESTDSGASFGASSVVATAASAASAVACALQADGSAAVLYAVAGVVYAVTRTATGAWSAPAAWSQSLTTVNGLAAWFESDYNVAVSGTDAGGAAGAWQTIFGVGGGVPPGSWLALAELASGDAGTNVSYLATGLARPDAPLAALVESYSGGGAYDRVQLASGVGTTFFISQLWREPRPFAHDSPFGVGVAAGGGNAWLCAPDGVWRASTVAEQTELTDDVLSLDLLQEWERGELRLELRNDDGRYGEGVGPAALSPGGELWLEPGFRLRGGPATSGPLRLWITAVRQLRENGVSRVRVEAVDGWGVLREWRASRQLTWSAGTLNAFQVLRALLQRAGLRVTGGALSVEATALQPGLTVRAGERGSTAAARLVEALPDELVMRALTGWLSEPTASDATDYAYGTGHALLASRIEVGRAAAGWARVFGDGVFAEAVDEAALLAGAPGNGASAAIVVDDNLTVQARADVRAATVLRRSALAITRGEVVVVPPNVGQEVGDVIELTEAASGLAAARFRVRGLRLRFERGGRRPRYEMTLALGEV